MAVATWALATVGACTLAWSAVDQVAARVTSHTPVIGDQSIRASLRDQRPDHPTVGTGPVGVPTTTAGTPTPTNANGTPAGVGTASDAGDRRSGTGQNGIVGGGPTSGSGPSPASAPPTPPTTAPPPPPPSPPPASGNASTFVQGGSVTASCSSGSPRLVGAIPAAGFAVAVASGGGQLVVDFTSNTHHSIVEAECEAAAVQFSTGEESTG